MAGPRPGYQGIQPGYRQGLLGAGHVARVRESLRPQTSLRPHRPPPGRCRLLLRRPHPRRRRTRLARRTQPRSHVRRRLALAVQQPQRLPLSLLCTRQHPFAPGAGAPTVRGWVGFAVGAPPPVRTGRAQTTSPAGPDSHPGRVLLRVGGGIGFCCRSTAPVRTGAGTNPPHPHLAVHHITTPPSSPLLLPPITPWIYPNPPSRRPNAVSQATYQSHRLRLGRVSEAGRLYLITAVTQDREPVFSDLNNARILVNTLRMEALQNGVQTWCYVVMPDHFHWLMQLNDESLGRVVGRMRGVCARKIGRRIWQRGFHDRAVRRDDDLKALARYVIANPIRAGLVESVGDYPHWDAVWL